MNREIERLINEDIENAKREAYVQGLKDASVLHLFSYQPKFTAKKLEELVLNLHKQLALKASYDKGFTEYVEFYNNLLTKTK